MRRSASAGRIGWRVAPVLVTAVAAGCATPHYRVDDPDPYEKPDIEWVEDTVPRYSQQEAVDACMSRTEREPLAPGSSFRVTEVETYAQGRRIDVDGIASIISDHEGSASIYEAHWYCTLADGRVSDYVAVPVARIGDAEGAAEPGYVVPHGYPDACVIKGNVSFDSGERIYHVPGQEYYDATVINEDFGERWFCSEEEAVAAGWRKSRA